MWIKNDLLGYPKYIIYQNPEMFSFSIDSLLLAHYINVRKGVKNILDLGTGNGSIPIYLTLKTKAQITGIEIQEEVLELAKKSVLENNLANQINFINGDLTNLKNYPLASYDLICSNPPFFKVDEKSNLNDSPFKTVARHEVRVTLESLIKTASKLLKNGGYFYLIHLPERLKECFMLLEKYNLEPKRMKLVYPSKNKKANHVLLEIKKSNNKGNLLIDPPLYIYENKEWTKEILEIYNFGRD